VKEVCASIAMDEGISARIAHRKNKLITNDTSHKKRSDCTLKRDNASLVKSEGTPVGGAQTRTQETKLKTRGM